LHSGPPDLLAIPGYYSSDFFIRNNDISISQQDLKLDLELVSSGAGNPVFRLAFHSSRERLLLPYPEVTGLQFLDEQAELIAEWVTRILMQEPLHEFELSPGERISFDLQPHINSESDWKNRWSIRLPTGKMSVRYIYEADCNRKGYNIFFEDRSRPVSEAKRWGGRVESPTIDFEC